LDIDAENNLLALASGGGVHVFNLDYQKT